MFISQSSTKEENGLIQNKRQWKRKEAYKIETKREARNRDDK